MEYSERLYRDTVFVSDISLKCCGKRSNALNYQFGPIARDNYWLILLHSGRGVLNVNHKKFNLQQGMIFVCFPNTSVFYRADAGSVWNMSWISINGDSISKLLGSVGITAENPVAVPENFEEAAEVIDKIYKLMENKSVKGSVEALGFTYIMLSLLISKECKFDINEDYVDKAIGYMKHNYEKNITIEAVAGHVGLERGYFSKLFCGKTGISPKQWLTSYRMEKAEYLIRETSLSVYEIAMSAGYSDPLYFSRLFRRYYGLCPSRYRELQSRSASKNSLMIT